MGKRMLGVLLCLALILGIMPYQVGAELPEVEAPAAILMDAATGTVLFEKNADDPLPLASVTKIMTLLLVMEALDSGKISMDDTVSASDFACSKGGSQVYLEPGEQMCMDEMLKSVVVSSANDCATALAEHVAGSESAFVELMNTRAKELGMINTHFVNCTGLDDEEEAREHLSTARDIAIMSRELLKHDTIRNYTTIWMDTVRNGAFGLSNTNKLVRFYDGATGLKTGYTSHAGHCLSASAKRDGIELIAVVLHCESSTQRFESAKQLLNYGFANYALVTPMPDTPPAPVKVTLGQEKSVQPMLKDTTPILIDKGLQAQVTRELKMKAEIAAPVKQGQELGVLTICAGDQVLAELPLVAEKSIKKRTWWQLTVSYLKTYCFG